MKPCSEYGANTSFTSPTRSWNSCSDRSPTMQRCGSMRVFRLEGLTQPAHLSTIAKQWEGRPPIFRLPPDLVQRGEQALRAMGVPEGAWFVCVHVRDGVYSPNDEVLHSYRNSSIENCELAVDAIVARGGWCIRMGENGTQPLRARKGVINYAASPFKSDWMDVFLGARNRFFLGNTSGLCLISTIAGVPAALANMTPFGGCYGMGPRDISIPKGLVRKDRSRLALSEIFGSEIANFRYQSQFERADLLVVENTGAQIRDLTRHFDLQVVTDPVLIRCRRTCSR